MSKLIVETTVDAITAPCEIAAEDNISAALTYGLEDEPVKLHADGIQVEITMDGVNSYVFLDFETAFDFGTKLAAMAAIQIGKQGARQSAE